MKKKNEKNEKIEKNEDSKFKKSDDSMSWRKKSDVSSEQDDLGYGYGYGYGYNRGYKNKRQRFKSDPNDYQQNNDY